MCCKNCVCLGWSFRGDQDAPAASSFSVSSFLNGVGKMAMASPLWGHHLVPLAPTLFLVSVWTVPSHPLCCSSNLTSPVQLRILVHRLYPDLQLQMDVFAHLFIVLHICSDISPTVLPSRPLGKHVLSRFPICSVACFSLPDSWLGRDPSMPCCCTCPSQDRGRKGTEQIARFLPRPFPPPLWLTPWSLFSKSIALCPCQSPVLCGGFSQSHRLRPEGFVAPHRRLTGHSCLLLRTETSEPRGGVSA